MKRQILDKPKGLAYGVDMLTKLTRIIQFFKNFRAVQEGVSGNGREGSRKTLSLPGQPYFF